MAKKKKDITNSPHKTVKFTLSKQQKILLGSFLILLGLALMLSFVSYFFTWQADQSDLGNLTDRNIQSQNWLNKFGANIGHFFIYDGFGVSSFILAFLVIFTGIYYFFDYTKKRLLKPWFWGMLLMVWFSVFFGFFPEKNTILSGIIGFETNDFLQDYIGLAGTILLMTFIMIVYLVVRLKLTPEMVINALKAKKKEIREDFAIEKNAKGKEKEKPNTKEPQTNFELPDEEEPSSANILEIETPLSPTPSPTPEKTVLKSENEDDVEMEVEPAAEEEEVDTISERLVKDFGE